MEKHKSFGGRNGFLCCLFGILLVLCYANAQDNVIMQVSDPTGNVNLSPFQQSISAYECLKNASYRCPDKYKLTEVGWVNITSSDTVEYCEANGCAEQTKVVLTCIHLVKRDYKFGDKSTVPEINNTITTGCLSGFTGTLLKTSNARRISKSNTISFVLVLLAVRLLTTNFNM